MSRVLQLGPLALPYELLVWIGAVVLGLAVGKWWGRRRGMDVESELSKVLAVGLVCARMAYVVQYPEAYFSAPLGILDIRDGGWQPLAGFIAAWLYAFIAGRKAPVLREPVLAATLATTLVWVAGTSALTPQPREHIELPTTKLAAFDGGSVALSDFAGRPTVINLWATWCPPCGREMPVLQQAQAEHPELNFVFLNQGESAASVSAFMTAHKLALHNVLLDTKGEMGAHLGRQAFPTTLFFDAKGQLVSTRIGELSQATLTERITQLAASAAPSATHP
jgi:thiol-disulfide isomerase/thioredoxin